MEAHFCPALGMMPETHVVEMLPWSGRGPQQPVPEPSPQTAAAWHFTGRILVSHFKQTSRSCFDGGTHTSTPLPSSLLTKA